MTIKEYNQWLENITAMDVFNAACNEIDNAPIYRFLPFYHSEAGVYESEHYFVLRSNDTYVAAICKSDGMCVNVLRMVYGYTPIIEKQIRRFFIDYADELPDYISPEYKTYR